MVNEKERVYRDMLANKDIEIEGLRKDLADYQRRFEAIQKECDSTRKDRMELIHKNDMLIQENLALKERLVKLDKEIVGLIDDNEDLARLLSSYQGEE